MKRITVYFDEGTHADLREFARRKGVSASELVRTAAVLVLEDDLDVIALDTRLAEGDEDAFEEWEEFKSRIRPEPENR